MEVVRRLRACREPDLEPLDLGGGYSNLVDNDRHTWNLGAGFELFGLRPLLPGSLAIDVHVAYSFLPARAHRKVLLVDAVGDYVSRGHIFAGGVTLEARFE